MTHYSLAHKFILVPQSMNIPDVKGSRGKGMEEARNNPSLATGEGQEQEGGYSRSTKRQQESPHCYMDGHLSSQKTRSWNPKLQKHKGRVVLRGDIVKDDSGACAVFTEQGSSASQLSAAKVMDVIARSPDFDGQAADAVSACTTVKLVDAPRLLKIPKSECPDVWIHLPRHKWPKSFHQQDCLAERQVEQILLELGW